MLLFLTIVFGIYVLVVVILAFGWARTMELPKQSAGAHRKIAVVVPFRREASSLPVLIRDMRSLNYPQDKAMFIFIDDHSEDGSADVAKASAAGDPRFHFLQLEDGLTGKKQAIHTAIGQANAEVIITTDADCRVPGDWLLAIGNAFSDPEVKMVVGPVRLTAGNFFEHIQAMEFASLVGTTGATLSYDMPSMCNGANLAFLRESFLAVGGYEGNAVITSGDDDFLMKKFAAKWKGSVKFLSSQAGVVTAQASPTVRAFISQRMRWAGKWKPAFTGSSMLAVLILAFHVCNILLAGSWLLGIISVKAFGLLAGAKLFAEVIFLFPVCRFLGVRWSWISFLFLQLFYSFYVVSVGCLSQILTTRWKGRKVITRVWAGIA